MSKLQPSPGIETEAPPTVEPAARRALPGGMFRSMVHHNYRLLFAGQVANSSAMWMEQVARGWLIYDMTGSVFLLGLVQACRALPLLLLGPVGGVLADRMDRQRQLMVAQLLNMVLNVLLATLIVAGWVQVWHVFATAFLAGCLMAFQQPARQALIPATVPRGDLANAVALNSIGLNLSRTVGPAVAGVLVDLVGVGGSYYCQAGLLLLAAWWTQRLRIKSGDGRLRRLTGSMWSGLAGGARYVRGNRTVLVLLLLSLLPIVLAEPYSSMLPVFARDVYNTGPAGLGLLLGSAGIGSAAGAVLVAVLGDFRRKGPYLLGGVMAFGLALAGFALSPSIWVAVPLLGLVGFASTSYRVVNQTLLQTNTEDEFRGRVMSIYLLDRGVAPLGSLLMGTLAVLLGAPITVALLGTVTFLVAVAVALKVPSLQRMT